VEQQRINDIQIGGSHYDKNGEQHWDRAWRLGWDFYQYQITKYIERWKAKNGLEDLKKAQHFLNKYIEIVEAGKVALPERPPHVLQSMTNAELDANAKRLLESISPPLNEGRYRQGIPDRF
jgi:hypothetical protein